MMFLSLLTDYTKIKGQFVNVITLLNLSFGIIAIMYIVKGADSLALLFILLAALFDRFDGMVARKFNTESDFGKELDSLCDLVSFGVAPNDTRSQDRKSTRLNSSHVAISYAVFCLKKKTKH